MAKYRALEDMPPSVRKGDIMEFKDPLVSGFQSRFEPYSGDEEPTDLSGRDPLNDPTAAGTQLDLGGPTPADPDRETGDSSEIVEADADPDADNDDKTDVINPSREELKARAAELGIDHAPNITTEKLLELVRAKEAELANSN